MWIVSIRPARGRTLSSEKSNQRKYKIMSVKIERRFVSKYQLRADSQGEDLVLTGYAAMFDSESEDLGGFREVVKPGAFTRSLRAGKSVMALQDHNPSLVLGRTTNGTLQLSEDSRGLKFRCVLPDTQVARDAHALVKRGDVTGCSFAFQAVDQSWADKRDGNGNLYACRSLLDVDLIDVSPVVTYPAYPDTTVAARNLFPNGVPAEIRSHLSTDAALQSYSMQKRRKLTDKVLSL